MNLSINPQQKFNPLPLPPHFEPTSVGSVWRVPYQDRAEQARQWASTHQISPGVKDDFKIALMLVDVQNTFCIPEFELFVAGRSGMGAVEDNQRLCEFIYRNLNLITQIVLTMDTHRAMQIFHPVYLVNERGEHPAPLTLITHEDILEGRWKFNPHLTTSLGISTDDGQEHLLHYTQELQTHHKYALTVWPYHAMLGGVGHALVSAVEEAVFFHTTARFMQPEFIIKGQFPRTESYSAIGPEVLTDQRGKPIAEKNRAFVAKLLEFDALVVAGQAKSHCVAWTIEDLLSEISSTDPSLAEKVYLLADCTSPVVVPGIVDYTSEADAAFEKFSYSGMHIVKSTQPILSWSGITIPAHSN